MPVITIDGGAQVGKGTTSKGVAKRYGYHLLDSGCLYRAVGLVTKQRGKLDDKAAIITIAQNIEINFQDDKVIVHGNDCTSEIRTEEVSKYASQVSCISEVRDALLTFQFSMRKAPGLVADGRDQGTLFDTPFRFFLKADPEEKTRRRIKDLQKAGVEISYEEVLQGIIARDYSDSNREVNQLKPHEDAIIIDTTNMLPTQVIDLICYHVNLEPTK